MGGHIIRAGHVLGCIYLVQGRDGYLGVDNFGDVILVHILVVYGGIGMMPLGAF